MAMASNYNTRPRAAELMIVDGEAVLIRPREQVPDLFAAERLMP
jgi:diaminopimelate decarboxylase